MHVAAGCQTRKQTFRTRLLRYACDHHMVEEVRACISSYAEVTRSLSSSEVKTLDKHAEICKSYLRVAFLNAVRSHPECACLVQYSGGCTPIRLQQRVSKSSGPLK
eukprot:5798789-Amphidinium_carterae.1